MLYCYVQSHGLLSSYDRRHFRVSIRIYNRFLGKPTMYDMVGNFRRLFIYLVDEIAKLHHFNQTSSIASNPLQNDKYIKVNVHEFIELTRESYIFKSIVILIGVKKDKFSILCYYSYSIE